MLVGYGDGLIRLYRGTIDLADASPPSETADHLLPAYPNPFNPMVTIPFVLYGSGHVELSIYDAAGRRVDRLIDEALPAGRHNLRWHGVDMRGRRIPSGTYFIRLKIGNAVSTGKIALVR